MVGCSKVVVATTSHRRCPGSIPRSSQILAAKQTPILMIRAEAECLILFFEGLGVCYLLAGGWQWDGGKSCLGPAKIQSNVFGGSNNCL